VTTTTRAALPDMFLADLWVEPTEDLRGLAVSVWVTDAHGRGIEGAEAEIALEPQWGVTLSIVTGPDGLGTGVAPDLLSATGLAAVFAEPASVSHPGFTWVIPEGGPSLMSVWRPLGNLGDPLSAHYGVRKVPWCPLPEAATVATMEGYEGPVVRRDAATLGPIEAWDGYLAPDGSRWLVLPGAAFLVEAAAMTPCAGNGLAVLEARISSGFPPSWPWMEGSDWDCTVVVPGAGDAGPGSVVRCDEIRAPGDDSQIPILTVLVLDGAATLAVTRAGLEAMRFMAEHVLDELGPGRGCADLTADAYRFSESSDDPLLQYFGVVLYWFVEGRPGRMDADGNGRPCEELFPSGTVGEFWSGGWYSGSP